MPRNDGEDRLARFEALAAGERGRMVRSAQRILREAAEAEDVVQETLERTWRRLDEIPQGKLKAYLFRAVEMNSLKRRARRRKHLPLEAAGDVAAPDGGTGIPACPRRADTNVCPTISMNDNPWGHLGAAELERALDGLGETQKAVLRMKYYLGMTFREIGAALSISSNTASSRCRYALAAVRRILKAKRQ